MFFQQIIMYRFEINSVWFRCPERPGELTLEQFVDLCAIQRAPQAVIDEEDGRYSTEQLLKMISIVSSVPLDLLESLPIGVVNEIAGLCESAILLQFPAPFVAQDVKKTPVAISGSTGEVYCFQPNYSFAKLKHVRVMEDWFSNNKQNMFDRPDYMLALLLYEDGEIMDLSTIPEKVKRIWQMDMDVLYHPLFFFYKTRNELLNHHKSLFRDSKGKKKKPKDTKKGFKAKVFEHWGWHHIANRLCEENRLGSTLSELDEMPMGIVMKQLSYMHDINEIHKAEAEKAAMQRK